MARTLFLFLGGMGFGMIAYFVVEWLFIYSEEDDDHEEHF